MNPELRVGLLVDSLHLPAWIRHVIAEIQASGFARVTLIVQKDGPRRTPAALHRRIWRHRTRLAYLAYRWIDNRLFRTANDAFAIGDASGLLAGAEHMRVTVSETRFCDYVCESDVWRICDARPDVLLRFGFRILKGSILHAARYGVWSYHHGDNHVNRGGPAGFWEVMDERPVTGSVLQILNEDLDNGRVIYRSYAKTDRTSVWRNRNSYYWKSAAFVMRRLRDLAEDPACLNTGSGCDELQVYSERLHRKPDNLETVALVGRYLTRRVRERIQRTYLTDQWAIAFRRSNEPVPHSTLFRFKEQLPPPGTSWADPFPVEDGEDYHVFLEEYDHAKRAGHISAARVTRDGAFEPPVKVVERPGGHLSYPFVFQWRGKWFMMPESASESRVEILSASRFPYEWTPEEVLLDGVRAVDSTLVMVDDRWWLFTSMAAHPAARHDDELHAFHGPTPFGPWTAHRRNPVKSDVRSARGAGRFFWKDNRLFRPAQDGSGRYGSATTINRIDRLTPVDFHETIVTRYEPCWRSGLTGTHTLNSCAGLTTIDFRHSRAKFLSILLVLLGIVAGTDAFAATYHVDASHSQADDNGSGSAEQPYRTIARGVRALRAGDQLVVRRGIYRENIEVTTSGTPDSPIRITGEPGVVIRGTRPLSGFQKADGPDGVYYADVGSLRPARMVETNASRWRPLPVEDPNGVRFEFRRPVLYQRVDALSTVHRVPGSFWLDPAAQRLYFRTFDGGDPRSGNYALEAGGETEGNFRVRASHVVVSSLTFEYARIVQLYQSASVRLESFDLLATPMQVLSSSNCSIDRLKVENYIARGKTFEWHQAGSGTSVSISDDSTATSLRNALVVRGWNAVTVGGTATIVDNVQIWGFPNHGLGVSGRNHTLSRLRIWNVQDTIYMQGGHNIEIRNSHVVEAIHIRNGSSQIKLRNNLLFGRGVFVLEDSKTGFDSDYNLFVAAPLDYRLGKVQAKSFGDVRRMHGLEMHSIEFGNSAGVVEGWEGRSTQPNALSLTADSPAIDSGDPATSVPAGGGKRADIGPFERGAANEAPGLRNRPTPPMPGDLRIIP